MKEKNKQPKKLVQKTLIGTKYFDADSRNSFNTRIALLGMRRGSTILIRDLDAKTGAIRKMATDLKRNGLGEWKPSTLNVPTGTEVKRIN